MNENSFQDCEHVILDQERIGRFEEMVDLKNWQIQRISRFGELLDLKNWQIWRIGRNGNDGRVRNDETNFEILKKWHHTWENGYHWKLRKFRQFQKIKIQGNHAYEKLDSNEKEHSKIKDLEFHSRSKSLENYKSNRP